MGKILEVINDLEKTIINECDNPEDYEGYIYNCLLYDTESAAEYYGITEQQFEYCVHRAFIRL